MIKNLLSENLGYKISYFESEEICYILSPMVLSDRVLEQWSEEFGINIAVMTGMDWNSDLTPWTAENISPTLPPFNGKAADFLSIMQNRIFPLIEEGKTYRRSLCGVSLSGLFALWAWMECELFTDIGSISGSFWYEGFTSWLERNVKSKTGKAYFALGEKEGGRKGPKVFADIRSNTMDVVNILHQKKIECKFQLVPGNHFSPIEPRFGNMFRYLYKN